MKKVYLAIPYTGMQESSYHQATRASVMMINDGINVFSPITHSHPFTEYGVRQDWEFWEKYDKEYIDWCDELHVLIPHQGIEMVKKSTGVQAEVKYATDIGKPVRYKILSDGKLRTVTL